MPAEALICSATTRTSTRDAERVAQPDEGRGQGAGQDHSRIRPLPDSPKLGRLDQLDVDAADAGEHVEVDREDRPQRDQRHLRRLTDPEPDDEQRDEGEEGHRPEHLHRGVDEVLPHPPQAGDDGQQGPDGHADHQSLHRPAERHPETGVAARRSSTDPMPPTRTCPGDARLRDGMRPVHEPSCQIASRTRGPISRRSHRQLTRPAGFLTACQRIDGDALLRLHHHCRHRRHDLSNMAGCGKPTRKVMFYNARAETTSGDLADSRHRSMSTPKPGCRRDSRHIRGGAAAQTAGASEPLERQHGGEAAGGRPAPCDRRDRAERRPAAPSGPARQRPTAPRRRPSSSGAPTARTPTYCSSSFSVQPALA